MSNNEFNPNSNDAVLGMILAKLETIQDRQEEHHTEFLRKFKDQDDRIEKVEKQGFKQMLTVMGLGTTTGGLGHFISKFFDK